MNIYLIGYRCTGKTSVGKALAEKLEWPFIDADETLVEQYGTTIAEIVSKEGWDSFREKESTVLRQIADLKNHVVATGGGVILKPENIKSLKESGVSVWLKASNEIIKQRMLKDIHTDDQRPSLTSKELDAEIAETLLSRTPLYEDTMAFYMDTDDIEISEVCTRVLDKISDLNR